MSSPSSLSLAGAVLIDRLYELHEHLQNAPEPMEADLSETTEVHLAVLQLLLVAGQQRDLTVRGTLSPAVCTELRRQGLENLWRAQFPSSL